MSSCSMELAIESVSANANGWARRAGPVMSTPPSTRPSSGSVTGQPKHTQGCQPRH
jgi:hypothetical protein